MTALMQLPGRFSSPSRANSKKCRNVTISWKQGSIVTEHASILVGSNTGELFEMFVEAGGPTFPKQANPGDYMLVINGTGNLPCDHVILVSCCRWDGDKGEAEKELRSIVRACLQQALKFSAASIAFPIIGTGGLGFPLDKASQIMISEVINFARQLEESSLKDIGFVVFDQDAKLVNAFAQEFTKAFDHTRGTSSYEVSGSGSGIVSRSRRLPSFPTLPSRTDNALADVSVEVVSGDLTNEKTDAIVNISAINMNMQEAGEVSKAIAAAAGPAVQTECTIIGQQAAGSAVVTGAGKLKAKHIIHMIPGEDSVQHIQKCIEKCLETADKYKFQSISIPACGTGGFKMSAGDSAQATFQALRKMRSNFNYLMKVRIVIFKSELLPEFSRKLEKFKTRMPNDTFGNDQSWKEIKKAGMQLPRDWCPMPKENGKEKTVHLVPLSKGSDEYKRVLKLFKNTGGTGELLKIERIQNPYLYRQYLNCKEKMDKDNGEMENERQLFHGTAGSNVNDINTRGFNRIFRGTHGTSYGEGVYFAEKASYSYGYASPDTNNNRHMYVARVLVGRYVLGNPQMKVPPKDPKTGTLFDSTANKNGSDASIFVAFHDAQCYPQYLITFQNIEYFAFI